ncbi:MAG: restriction endonuclease subunit S [Deltaproteobacteria bacterium]|nr:restriction endonuclease subunit S [Deltaproteobacteria bacterium]
MKTIIIDEVANIVSKGTTPTSIGLSFSIKGIPFLRGENILGTAVNFSTVKMFIDENAHQKLNRSALQFGDVLVTIAGTIGRIGHIDSKNVTANCNQAVAFVRMPQDRIDPIWLCLLLSSPEYQELFAQFVVGGAIPNVSLQQIKSIEIPDITIEAQRGIAARLKTQMAEVEKARKTAEVQQSDIPTLKISALDKLFDYTKYDPVRIGLHAKLQSGFAFKSKEFKPSGIKLLRNANVSPGEIKWNDVVYLSEDQEKFFDAYKLKLGDVIISLDRPLISSGIKSAKLSNKDIPSLLVQRVGRFILNEEKILPDYLFGFMKTSHFKSAISGHDQSLGVPHISPTQVESIEIPLPDVNIQKEMASQISEIIEIESAIKKATINMMTDLDSLSKRILSQAFEMN